MTLFSYKATDASGKIVTGTVDADMEGEVVAQIQAKGYIPIRILPCTSKISKFGVERLTDIFSFLKNPSGKDVMIFTQDLSGLLTAGLPMDKALSILIDVMENDRLKTCLNEVLKNIKSGSRLSDALGEYPDIFSGIYVNMVMAGESGGVLALVLQRLGIFLENSQDLKDYIKSSLVYPVFLMIIGGLSIIILLTVVIPKFSIIFSDLGQAVPFSTMLLLRLSDFVSKYWILMVGLICVLYIYSKQYIKTAKGRMKIDNFKIRAPFLGALLAKIEVSRFVRTLSTLLKSGVPILQALVLAKGVIGNRVVLNDMDKVIERVKKGDRISWSIKEVEDFPDMVSQMITVGEETGRMDEMLQRIADNYEKKIKNIVKSYVSLFEPVMILAMGIVVGAIVISMLMAIFSMNDLPF